MSINDADQLIYGVVRPGEFPNAGQGTQIFGTKEWICREINGKIWC